jgi:hypothetical protein
VQVEVNERLLDKTICHGLSISVGRSSFHRLEACFRLSNVCVCTSHLIMDPSHLLASHLINQIRSSLSVLEQLNVLQAIDADAIRTKLPPPNGPFPALVPKLDTAAKVSPLALVQAPPALPQRAQEIRGRAVWDYTGNVSTSFALLTVGSG